MKLLDIGPPVGKPVQYRISGPDIQKVRDISMRFAGVVGQHPLLTNMIFDWNEPSRVVKVDVLQDKARQLGVSSEDIATVLNSIVEGASATQVRDNIYLIDVIGRADAQERGSIETLQNLQIAGSDGKLIPLSAVANLRYDVEQAMIASRDRIPTITLKAAIKGRPSRRRSSPSFSRRWTLSARRCRSATRSRSAAPWNRAPKHRDRLPPSHR